MGKRNNKVADTVAIQLLSICQNKPELINQAQIVHEEFKRVYTVDNIIKNQNHLMLNKVLHATRAMDTGMRTFLELHDAMPISQYSMGAYLKALRKGKANQFDRLNQGLAARIQQDFVDKRNVFLHAAGKFPSKREAELLVSDAISYLQTIINLA